MKKSKIKLDLNKKNISNLETSTIIGGASGKTCDPSYKHYNTCYMSCNDSFHLQCPNR
ncbi:MAG: hypothetical protein AB8B65_16785 [Kordia sp.]|uniref:hypothetical protein n=1 Tax=Kordia sp. TaxID=1965332 RepID=UPI003859B8C7